MIIKITGRVVAKKETRKGVWFVYQISDGKEIYQVMSKKSNYQMDKTYDFTVSFSVKSYFDKAD